MQASRVCFQWHLLGRRQRPNQAAPIQQSNMLFKLDCIYSTLFLFSHPRQSSSTVCKCFRALCLNLTLTISVCPLSAAFINGVWPFWSLASTLAPWASRPLPEQSNKLEPRISPQKAFKVQKKHYQKGCRSAGFLQYLYVLRRCRSE